jgi:CHAD domain-containing protein
MAIAALKAIQYHFDIMRQNDTGSYSGEDIEYVHDMRVAVRRIRTAYRVFDAYLPPSMQPYLKTLKRTGRTLGVVRDMDVFRENYESYAQNQSIDISASNLTHAWNAAYIYARHNLAQYLTGKRYLTFRRTFDQVIEQALSEVSQTWPSVMEQLIPFLEHLMVQCKEQYQIMAQSDTPPLAAYHQLRIFLKYFRYSLEYFRMLLGQQGEMAISQTKIVQDHLGALQDAIVARRVVRTINHWGAWTPPTHPYTLIPSKVRITKDSAAYLEKLQSTIDDNIRTFPDVWKSFTLYLDNHPLDTALKKYQNTL